VNDFLWHNDDIFVNWKVFSNIKNKQGRLPLFIALEEGVKWSDGLDMILKGNGGAIENVDAVTGFEAFMLSAVGTNSNLETVFNLLQDHPAAINPYVVMDSPSFQRPSNINNSVFCCRGSLKRSAATEILFNSFHISTTV